VPNDHLPIIDRSQAISTRFGAPSPITARAANDIQSCRHFRQKSFRLRRRSKGEDLHPLEAESKKLGLSNQKVTLSPATRAEVSGTDAYVVVPAVYAFTEKGVAKRESAHMTFVLKKGSAGWLIHGWTWNGPMAAKPQTPARK